MKRNLMIILILFLVPMHVFANNYETFKSDLTGSLVATLESKSIDQNADSNTIVEENKQYSIDNMHYSIINYKNLCNNSSVSSTMMIIGYILEVVKWLAPLIIIVTGMIDFGKASIYMNDNSFKNIVSPFARRFVAGISIFFVITIVDVFSDIFLKFDFMSGMFSNCTECMLDPVECSNKVLLMKQEEEKIKKEFFEDQKKAREEWLAQQQQSNNNSSNNEQSSPNNSSNNQQLNNSQNGKIQYFNAQSLGCKIYYDPSKGTLMKNFGFASGEIQKMKTALTGACSFINNYSFVNYLQSAGSYVLKRVDSVHSYHPKGLAVDLNNLYTYTSPITNKKYTPYASQGKNTWNNYKKFICEVCDGKENCVYNINYQIYHRYFKQYDWCWGGNWSPNSFDPMHFEKRTGGCLTSQKQKITCS